MIVLTKEYSGFVIKMNSLRYRLQMCVAVPKPARDK